MFDIGFLEMMVIGVLALLVLGPERLPGAIKSCIQTVRSIKEVANGFKQEVSAQIDAHELHANLKKAEELGMKNIGKDLQDSVNELKAAAASVQRPYQQSKSWFEHNSIGASSAKNDAPTGRESDKVDSIVPEVPLSNRELQTELHPSPEYKSTSAAQADFDDYQHSDNKNYNAQIQDMQLSQDESDQQRHTDSSFDNSLLDESARANFAANQKAKQAIDTCAKNEKATSIKPKNDHE